jgi:hypothetical protein
MKKFILLVTLVFSLNSFCQTKPTSNLDPVLKKALYTKTEKQQSKKNFHQQVDKIGMSPDKKSKYLAIVDKYSSKVTDVNKSRKLTKSQCTNYINTSFQSLNQEIKPLLTPEQYNKHKLIADAFQNSILNRIKKQ